MHKNLLYIFLYLLFPVSVLAQDMVSGTEIDSLYREDQFYIGLTYNILVDMPEGVKNQGFSGGLHFGFLRDMPINKRRNIAIAAGLGYAVNKYGYTMFIGDDGNDNNTFIALDDDFTYDKNRFVTHQIEMPIEFRWRTSTPESYRFWRIYSGVKLGYVYYHKATFVQGDNKIQQTAIPEFNKFRTSVFLNFGYNTFNFQVQYSLNPFFNDNASLDGQPIDFSTFKIGLIFYIL